MTVIEDLLHLLHDERSHLRDPALIVVDPKTWEDLNKELTAATDTMGLQEGLASQGFYCSTFFGVPVTNRAEAVKPFVISAKELEKGAAAR